MLFFPRSSGFRRGMSPGPVAVIDVGSNTIKLLVAKRAVGGGLLRLTMRTVEARIGTGISHDGPVLSAAGMERGLDAILSLLADAHRFRCERILLVATSAVRDARNGPEFAARVLAATGQPLRILTGGEEASAIGHGLTCDPFLRDQRDFQVFDLGGGSLECLTFRNRQVEQATSLPLGCVRLMEKFVGDPALPFSTVAAHRVAAHTREVFAQAGFGFPLPAGTPAVGTGGSVTTVRAVRAAREGRSFEATSSVVTTVELRELLARLGPLPLNERQAIPGLPPGRADVFPTALATLLAVAELGGISEFRNSTYTLRHGLADEALATAK